ncbi:MULTISPECIES: ABC transporter permease subunit [Halomonadaceae]|jgi:putrescine transport system permease protein|uniref:Putrescine transport system permease protein PotH n=1 Tax=Vreelandella titanicae TaxID=664683 RepID=A0A653V532_9GAMM|nr:MULTISPECIES: ABC transporter permease subunit [Halomonas]QKS24270.1 Putrescine transport system permease protein PotH [Halomonas titanicae]CAD5247166.1 putrescine transporter subunit: membrane component of ABC superfamily [Halomonas sp. 59]CAD5247301.1 putrescine transporter subunit: membrane component of ABC superfamily [Halomonas sp. 113]CAD5252640.1 putrescine transporter subunit: membrane component of ABC superfamily [Halomonas sp. 156]CAD5289586.1 putrescine transporter subunit: membr|tara:strand:- start:420 stop:1328 length:909 start_codon:yes stop_codon:yes gene_type:complete
MKLSRFSALLKRLQLGRRAVIAFPLVWLTLFFLLPFALVLKISLSEAAIAIPPYGPLLEYVDQTLHVFLNLGNYLFLLSDSLYIAAYWGSVKTAFIATLACLLLGYPMAYAMARAPARWQLLLLLLVMLPSWTSFLIRVYAWMGILSNSGLINNLLIGIGLIDSPLRMMNTQFSVTIGIVYAYLPFMVLPLYAHLTRMDNSLLEAAADLGSRKFNTFIKVTLPLSTGGIVAGSMLVFIPAVGEFVIPELLGGPDTLMIGKVLWEEFFLNRDWPVASALAMVMLLLLLVPIVWFHRYQSKELE